MGTSKSQPSPTGRSGSGKAWQDAIDSLAVGTSTTHAFDLIIRAYQKEYDQQTLDILADKGVLAIEKLVNEYQAPAGTTDSSAIIADYFIKARMMLSEKQSNSFLAELALSAGTNALASETQDRGALFRTSYFSKLLEYIVSRDLPRIFGTAGLPNNYSAEQFLNAASKDFKAIAKGGHLSEILSARLKKVGD